MENHSQCKVCNSIKLKEFKHKKVNYKECENCGFIFLKDYPDLNIYQQKFESDFVVNPNENIKNEFRRIYRLPKQLFLLKKIKKYMRAPASILDVGCGRGYFLDEARRHGYEIDGIEYSSSALYYCSKIGINIHKNINTLEKNYDIILIHNTLSKTPNPIETISRYYNLLNPNGIIILTVPFRSKNVQQLFDIPKERFFTQEYLQQFSNRSLEILLNQTKLKILEKRFQKAFSPFETKSFKLSAKIFKEYFALDISTKDKINWRIKDITRKEIFVIAQK